MTKKLCFMTRLLAAVLAVVMLSSAIYLAVEADHDCSGEDCAICRQISICENLLKSLGLAGAAAAITAAFTYTVCRAILPCAEMSGTLTLVALKVKLSN
ncbi:hypothetical protein NIA13_09685 [Oscillibacter valericigenes]|nr:hypothetical protein [Oscillibacter valericigenes]